MKTCPPRLLELVGKFMLPYPWIALKKLPGVLKELQEAEEDAGREFSKRDPVLSIEDPNYQDMYDRLKRFNEAVTADPRVALLRRKKQEAEVAWGEFQEIESLVKGYNRKLLKLYPAYVWLDEKLDVDNHADAMRSVYAQLEVDNNDSTPTEEDRIVESSVVVNSPTKPDGPMGDRCIMWKGKPYDVPTGNVYRLIKQEQLGLLWVIFIVLGACRSGF